MKDRHGPVKLKKAERPLVMAIDIGTSSTRALIYDAHGRPVKKLMAQVGYTMETTADGGVFADPKFIVDSTIQCIDRLMADLGQHADDVKAVGFDTFWHNMMGMETQGRPTTPLLNWADTRPRSVMDALRKKIDAKHFHQWTGCVLHPSYLPAKLLWVQKKNPAVMKKTATWLSIGEYLYYVLFGETVCGISMASGTGLFNPNSCDWEPRIFNVLPITPKKLGRLDDAPLHGLKKEFAKRWPALADVPWLPAVGDGASSNVGSGCVAKDRLCMVMGTSGAMRICWEGERTAIPDGLWVYRVDKRRFLMGGALSDGGNLRKWLLSHLGLEGGKKAVDQALETTMPDCQGLTVLPFWAGERSTGWHEHAQGLISGFNLNVTRDEIVRSSLEAVCYRYAAIYDIFKKQKMPVRTIIASGGGFVDSAVLTQVMADVLGAPVTQSGEAEGSARGAAILALETIGAIKDASKAPVPLGQTFKPNPKHTAIYQRARARQQRLYDLVAKHWWGEE
jgi:gluconokinase